MCLWSLTIDREIKAAIISTMQDCVREGNATRYARGEQRSTNANALTEIGRPLFQERVSP
ncbi:MAG: hypothetical protein M1138_01680 [Candidatus Thermoplasmatota archaeon]|nr:hypothetical protein [Candidatus Thermoplasmatota archaeon]